MYRKVFSKNGRYYWFASPWFIAIVLTAVFFFFYPEYKIEHRTILSDDSDLMTYEDMDCDGKDDVLKVRKKNTGIYEVISLKRKKALDKTPIFTVYPSIEDSDNDHFKELYFLTQSQDSIFLTTWDIKTNVVKSVFVEKVNAYFRFNYLGFIDSNNDGCKEFYFWFCCKRYESKRFVCRYDIRNNTLFKTKGLDARINGGYITTVNGQSKIVLNTLSYKVPDKETVNYQEKYGWVFIMDKDLNFDIDPIRLDMQNYWFASLNIKQHGKDRICLIRDNHSRSGNNKDKSTIYIYNYSGKRIYEKVIPYDLHLDKNAYYKIDENNDSKIFLTSRSGGLLEFNSDLTYKDKHYPGGIEKPIPAFVSDIDQDGGKEILFYNSGDNRIVVTKADFSNTVIFKRPELLRNVLACTSAKNIYENVYRKVNTREISFKNFKKENIVVKCTGLTYFLYYGKDESYWMKYLYALGMFIGVYILVWFIRYFVTKSVEEKYAVENTIAQLKFQNVRNQMSPHFTLNAMNSIASLIYKEDRETAYDYLCKLARLVRSSLIDANRLERSLKEELEFVSSYLALQKFRFKDRFDYAIKVDDPQAYGFNVMPFLVQTFVENAMKHGLKNKESGGKILIDIKSVSKGIVVVVEDNGQGRKAAAKNKTESTGKGIKLVNEYISIINKIDNRNINIDIIDLESNNIPKGTRVEIFIDKA